MARCRHRRTTHRRWNGSEWYDNAHGVNCADWIGLGDASVVCKDCGHWLPLGPATDNERTALEIRAAEIALNGCESADECVGWSAHQYDRSPVYSTDPVALAYYERQPLTGWIKSRHAGYLARAIAAHEES